jgi:hypothetical protein
MGFPIPAPDQLRLFGLEERFDSGIVIAIALAANRRLHPVFGQNFLVVVRTVSVAMVAIRTASLRNSSVLPVPLVHLLCCALCDQRSGKKPRQVHPPQGKSF